MTEGLLLVATDSMPLDHNQLQVELKDKVGETLRALAALKAVFNDIGYEIYAGQATEGNWNGFKMVETIVSLTWGESMPSRFTVRSFLNGDNNSSVMEGISEAISRVIDFCVGRAEEPHTDMLRRLIAVLIELKTFLGNCRMGNHISFNIEPREEEAGMSLTAYLNEAQLDLFEDYDEDHIRDFRTSAVAFVKEQIKNRLETEDQVRAPVEEVVAV